MAKNTFEALQSIDALLFQKKYTDALQGFTVMLGDLATIYSEMDQVRDFHFGSQLDEGADICQRACFQWQMLLQSNLSFMKLNLQPILVNVHMLHALLMGTYSGNLDHFMVTYHEQRKGQYDQEALLHQLLAWCPNSRLDFSPFDYYSHAPDLVLAHAVACLSDLALLGERANKARTKAIDFLMGGQAKPEQLSRYDSINTVSLAWMRCSYADDDRKHQIKPFLSQVVDRMRRLPKTFLLPEAPRLKDGKPVLFLPLEGMTRNHAMYRCYAEMIVACRKHFYTVGLGVDSKSDDAVAQLFDHYELVENSRETTALGKAFEQVQKIINDYAPAMVWFPSVGMSSWVVVLANRRMAPLQVMTLGHPATSMSPEMDAMLLTEDLIGARNCFSEKRVVIPEECLRFQLPQDIARVAPLHELPVDGVVRIVIPSVSQKLTAAFVRCLREVQERASRPVELVFFTGERGVNHAAATQNLLREVKRATVHGVMPYDYYIKEINRCQIHACTFPFGGTNSLLDSLRQGLPLVTLEGDEAHARIDASFIRKIGLPETLICHSEQEYVDCLLHLVEHPDELQRLRRYLIDDVSVDKVFMQEGNPDLFADLLYRLHQGGRANLSGTDVIRLLSDTVV